MDNVYMLTTLDNPFDPFNDFASWFSYDLEKGHHTASRIARIAQIDSEMSQKEEDAEMDRAMNLIVKYDFEGKYIKVSETQVQPAEKDTVSG